MSSECPPYAHIRVDTVLEIAARTRSLLAVLLYVVLRARTNNAAQGWNLSVEQILSDMGGLGSRRSAQRWLSWLERESFVERTRRGRVAGGGVAAAGLGAREIESRFYARAALPDLDARRCQAIRSSRKPLVCAPGELQVYTPLCPVVVTDRSRAVTGHRRSQPVTTGDRSSPVMTGHDRSPVIAGHDRSRPVTGHNNDQHGICAEQSEEHLAQVSSPAVTVKKSSERVPRAVETAQGVPRVASPIQISKNEEFPSEVSPSSGRPERKVEISSSSSTPIASTEAVQAGLQGRHHRPDFGLDVASQEPSEGHRCRRRSVSVEMVDFLVPAILNAMDSSADPTWLTRCAAPDDRLVLKARDHLRELRKDKSYSGTLCQRTIGRGLRRVWRLCNHLVDQPVRAHA